MRRFETEEAEPDSPATPRTHRRRSVYWKGQFDSMVQARGGQQGASGVAGARSSTAVKRPSGVAPRRRGVAVVKTGIEKKAGPKVST